MKLRIIAGMLLVSCGDDGAATVDAGQDSTVESRTDTHIEQPDTGTDSGSDAGPEGCTEGCAIQELAIGREHICARRENGEVLCWGANRNGQLGDGRMLHTACNDAGGSTDVEDCSAQPVVAFGVDAVQLSTNGGPQTCALEDDGRVKCWGLSDTPPPGSDQRKKIFEAEEETEFSNVHYIESRNANTCALIDGQVHCSGANGAGQIGNGTIVEQTLPQAVSSLSEVLELDVGEGPFACARKAEEIWCWGSNQSGQLGDGEAEHGECGEEPATFDCATEPVQVAQLGSGADRQVVQVDLGANHACAVANSQLWCWGNNEAGQLGIDGAALVREPTLVPGVTAVVEVSCGLAHTCVRINDGSVECFGANAEGQLGDGQEVGSHENCTAFGTVIDCSRTPVSVELTTRAVRIEAGFQNTCAILDDDSVWCWGYNTKRQLGIEDRLRRASPQRINGLD